MRATLYRNGLKQQEVFADDSGRFSFLALTEGDYEVRVEAKGYRSYQRRVSLRYQGHDEENFSVRLAPIGAVGDSRASSRSSSASPASAGSDQLEAPLWRKALLHPESYRDLTPILRLEPGPDSVQVVFGLPSAQVRFETEKDRYRARLLFLVQVFDGKGKPVFGEIPISRGFQLNLSRSQFQDLGRRPVLARDTLRLTAGRYRVVLVAVDERASRLGTAVMKLKR